MRAGSPESGGTNPGIEGRSGRGERVAAIPAGTPTECERRPSLRQDEHLSALLPGARLHLYTISTILGAGGFGITYKAREDITNREVAIKEYLPTAFAVRDRNGSTVRPLSEGAARDFDWGLERFRQEAKLLIELRHPNIMPVLAYFEANATGYLVMEFQDGASLGERLRSSGTLSEAELLSLVVPLLDGVEEVHRHDYLHRDIKPENILVRADGTPVLIDFGAARQALGEHSKNFTTLLTEGYAPFEQYAGTGNQGPWSDIYALAAVMFRCVMGRPPVEAPRRAVAKLRGIRDPMAPDFQALRDVVSSDLAFAIEAGLCVVEPERPQTVAAFRELIVAPAAATLRRAGPMAAADASPPTSPPAGPAPTLIPDLARRVTVSTGRPAPAEPKRRRRVLRFAVIGGLLAVAAASGAAYVGDQRSWLPAAFRQAGPETPARPQTASAAKPAAEDRAKPQEDAAAEARKQAEQRAREAERRANEGEMLRGFAEYQRLQLELIEAERRYLDARRAELEKRRAEANRPRPGDPGAGEGDPGASDNAGTEDADRRRVDEEPPRIQPDRARRAAPDPQRRLAPDPRRYDAWPPAAPGQRGERPSLGPRDNRDVRRPPSEYSAPDRMPPSWQPPAYDDY
jgi:serine/threonine protein kinase